MTEQGYPPRQPGDPGRSGRSRVWQEPRRTGWQMIDAFDEKAADDDAPPWAVPGGIEPVRPARRPQQPPGPDGRERVPADRPQAEAPASPDRKTRKSRAAVARRRRSKRRLVTWGGALLVVAVVVAAGYQLSRSPAPKSRYITTWQKGELRAVPDACRVMGAGALRQYLAGTPTSIQPYNYQAQSQCTYTVDAKPTFRVLNITAQAYSPNLTAPGNGSATATAIYTFEQQRLLLTKPPKNTPQPPATITSLGGLGSQALVAVQVFHLKLVIDRVTVIARYRNVLITVYLSGQASGGFGPVSVSDLRSGAIAVTRDLLVQVKHQPAAG